MALEKLYFKHEFNARNDPKLLKIKRKLGLEGVGIYWCLIEVLYERNGFINEEELEDICYFEQMDMEKVNQVIELAEFEFDIHGDYYLDGVIQRIAARETYCNKQKANANKRWGKTEKHEAPIPEWFKDYEEKKNQEELEKVKEEKISELKEYVKTNPFKD